MSLKHRVKHGLKRGVRELYARLLFHTGLHRLADRLAPPRLLILAGHCVDAPSNAGLPPDMKIRSETLRRWLSFLGRNYRLCTVTEGVAGIVEGGRSDGERRGWVALTMDDGYRDNEEVLLPLLAETDAPATVYLETEPLDRDRVNWSHKYFWLCDRMSVDRVAHALLERANGADRTVIEEAAAVGESSGYRLKRALKYDVDPEARDTWIDAVFAEQGGDERELARALYLDWEGAKRLRDGGIEIGAHTVHHPVLARLEPDRQRDEIEGSCEAIEAALGVRPTSVAYPFGRRWDFDDASARVATEAGLYALTSHSGANRRGADTVRLKRLAFHDATPLHLVVAEACGGFSLAERLGLRLSE